MNSRIIEEMIKYFHTDVRRVNHALKVHGFATAIAGREGVAANDATVISLAAALHDIGIKEAERKYNSTAGKYQESEGPPLAEQILQRNGIEASIVARVCFLIGNHHSYQKIDGLDFQILVEADFLVNIFEDGLGREAIKSIREKYFKTKTGIAMLDALYLF